MMPRDYHFKLRAMRMALGLTIKYVANRLKYCPTLLSKYENRKYAFSEVYDAQMQDLLEGCYTKLLNSRVGKKGQWYRRYVELKATLIEIQLYEEAGIKVPESIIEESRLKAVSYSTYLSKSHEKKEAESV